jgi:gluconokinase
VTGDSNGSPTVVVVMGVAGSGKSTLGRALAERLDARFLEADDLHLTSSVAKMRRGEALTDADRWPWLSAVADWLEAEIAAGHSAVTACSALKRRYRERLARGRPEVRFVHVSGSPELVAQRMSARRDHYFPMSLIASQFEALEPPANDEGAIVVDMALPIPLQVDQVLARLSR